MLANVPPCVLNATWASAAMFAIILDVTGATIPIAVIWKKGREESLPSPLRMKRSRKPTQPSRGLFGRWATRTCILQAAEAVFPISAFVEGG